MKEGSGSGSIKDGLRNPNFDRHDLAGGGGGMRLSNYALTMLVVYYLQQLNSPLLYTVHTLQKSMGEWVS